MPPARACSASASRRRAAIPASRTAPTRPAHPGDAALASDGGFVFAGPVAAAPPPLRKAGPTCMLEGAKRVPPAPSPEVASAAGVTYASNPPSSGPHCAQPAVYGNYNQPLDVCQMLEHFARGGVAILYNCPGGCPEITARFGEIAQRVQDPDCRNTRRVLFTAAPTLDVKVAAAAWGATWRSGCLDDGALDSLIAFVNDNIGARNPTPGARSGACP